MDYVEIVEQYVRDAWARGDATAQIKADLVAKRWPEEMVEAVIDRLVKQKVEADEGKVEPVAGPDLWSRPTWPQPSGGWSTDTITSSPDTTINSNNSKLMSLAATASKPGKRRFSERLAASTTINLDSNPVVPPVNTPVMSTVAPAPETLPTATPVTAPNVTAPAAIPETPPSATPAEPLDMDQMSPAVRAQIKAESAVQTLTQVLSEQKATPPETLPPVAVPAPTPMPASPASQTQAVILPELTPATNKPAKMSRLSVIADLKAKDQGGKKLPQKLQENRISRSDDEKIQLRSLIFLGCLFFVIILALLWRFFVIQ